MVLSDGGGWNVEAAGGSPALLVLGPVCAVGRVGAGAGGGRVAVRAGAAGGARRAGRGFGASTVTCGTVMVGAAPLCGVSGAPCCGCAAGACAGAFCGVLVAGEVCGAGVDGWFSGVVVAGGVSGAGVCDEATPVKQMSMSAELLSSSKRRLRIHVRMPPKFPELDRGGSAPRAASVPPRLREGAPARCQARGGARAWKRTRGCAVKSNATAVSCRRRKNMPGSGNGGVSAGAIVPARWISTQIGQQSSARFS